MEIRNTKLEKLTDYNYPPIVGEWYVMYYDEFDYSEGRISFKNNQRYIYEYPIYWDDEDQQWKGLVI